jgi:Protein of unknown function (DUF3579)
MTTLRQTLTLSKSLSKAGALRRFGTRERVEFLCGATHQLRSPADSRQLLKPMVSTSAKELYILGLTREGKTFRPSDWAERLAGVMSQFRPGGSLPGRHLAYSPWCIPTSIEHVKCVIVQRELRDYDVRAWDFCVNFARDNDLQVSDTRPVVPPSKSRG